MKDDLEERARRLAATAADAGKIIEVGFIGFMAAAYPKEIPASQRDQLRSAFFAGAQNLFSTIMAVMDSDREPTAQDLRRMSMIHNELENFIKDFEARHLKTEGSA